MDWDQRWNRWERWLKGKKNIGGVAGNDGEGRVAGIINYHFAYTSLIGHITVEADGIILSPLHSYQILSIASFFIYI